MARCHWESRIWVNCVFAETNNSLSVPHAFEISKFLKDGTNQIVVCLDNSVKINLDGPVHQITNETQTNWNGIIGRLEIQKLPKVRISNLKVLCYNNINKIVLKGITSNLADKTANIAINITDNNKDKNLYYKQFNTKINTNNEFEISFM